MSSEAQRSPAERNRPEDSPGDERTRRDVIGLWTGILAGPILWFTHQQVSFVLVPWVCDHGGVMWLHVTTVVLLVGTTSAGLLARGYWRRQNREPSPAEEAPREKAPNESPEADDPPPRAERMAVHQRVRFMAILGVFGCLFFSLVIIAQEIPNFFLDPCQR